MSPATTRPAASKRGRSPDPAHQLPPHPNESSGGKDGRGLGFTSLLRVVDHAVGNSELPHPNLPAPLWHAGPSGSSSSNLAPLLHHYARGTHSQVTNDAERGEIRNGGRPTEERADEDERADEGEGETEGDNGGKSLKTTKRAAQNRAAQRAFRERKENYVRELERKSVMLDETMSRERTLASQLTTVQAELYALQTDRQDQMSSQSSFHRERAAWEKERIEWRLESEGQKREVEGLRGALKESRRMCDVAMMGAATAAAAAAATAATVETERR